MLGWLSAIRRGHARLHRGLDVGVPSLILQSDPSWFSKKYGPRTDVSDVVLDVRQIARWAGCLGGEVTSVPIPVRGMTSSCRRTVPARQNTIASIPGSPRPSRKGGLRWPTWVWVARVSPWTPRSLCIAAIDRALSTK